MAGSTMPCIFASLAHQLAHAGVHGAQEVA
jgi:hypothetical protein